MTATKITRRPKPSRKPDYVGYEQYKRTLWNMPHTPEEYEKKIKAAAKRYGV